MAPAIAAADERMSDPHFALAVRRAMTFRPTISRTLGVAMLLRGIPLAVLYITGLSFGMPVWQVFAAIIAIAWLTARVWPLRVEDTLSPRLATHWLGIGLCPCCLYGLVEVVPSGEGRVVCPECGAAWAHERVHGSGNFESKPDSLARGVATVRAYGATLQQGIYVKDARGVRVPMALTLLADRLVEVKDDELRGRLEQGVECIRRSGRFVRWVVGGFFAGLGCLVLYLKFRYWRGQIPAAPSIMMMGFPFLMAVAVFWGDFGYNHGRIAKRLLRLLLCPSCGADLKQRATTGGTMQCDCGAAWKVTPAPSSP